MLVAQQQLQKQNQHKQQQLQQQQQAVAYSVCSWLHQIKNSAIGAMHFNLSRAQKQVQTQTTMNMRCVREGRYHHRKTMFVSAFQIKYYLQIYYNYK